MGCAPSCRRAASHNEEARSVIAATATTITTTSVGVVPERGGHSRATQPQDTAISLAAKSMRTRADNRRGPHLGAVFARALIPPAGSPPAALLQQATTSVAMSTQTISPLTSPSPSPSPQPRLTQVAPNVEATARDSHLFTNINQLCYSVVSQLVLKHRHKQTRRAICLFVFGAQGSSVGEIVYELVQHSPLVRAKTHASAHNAQDCPLYHHIEASALIAANIDARIKEYNDLVAQTAHHRRRQKLAMQRHNADASETVDAQSSASDESLDSARLSRAMLSSSQEQSSTELSAASEEAKDADDEGAPSEAIALTTRQRSMLQLKLLRYSNSITARWVFGLIERELERLEQLKHEQEQRDRVYLVSLIPNQLNMFKTCLYLRQKAHVKELGYAFHAIKFERRTNIRLLRKERVSPKTDAAALANGPEAGALARLSNTIKLPNILGGSGGSSSSSSNGVPLSSKSDQSDQQQQQQQQRDSDNEKRSERSAQMVTSTITNILLDNVNEKLSPHFTEQFVQEFADIRKLTCVRYNPVHNYNYASVESDESVGATEPSEERARVCSSSSSSQLRVDDNNNNNSAASGRLSAASSFTSINSSLSSADTLLLSDNTASPQLRASSATPARSRNRVKWAVELSVFDARTSDASTSSTWTSYVWKRRHKQATAGAAENKSAPSPQQANSTQCLIFTEPKRAASGTVERQASHSAGSYVLAPVRVAYANERSHVTHELRRVHRRVLRVRPGPHQARDLAKLAKLVHKSLKQLQADCVGWLHEAIDAAAATAAAATATWPTLIVYAIRVDVSQLCDDVDAQHDNKTLPEPPQLKLNDERALDSASNAATRPCLRNQQPQEDQTTTTTAATTTKPKRHVRFRLIERPEELKSYATSAPPDAADLLRRQHRHWIHAALFVSAAADSPEARALPLLAALLSSGQQKQQ